MRTFQACEDRLGVRLRFRVRVKFRVRHLVVIVSEW